MNPILFSFGSFDIYWYSLFIFLGLSTGCFLLIKNSKKLNITEDEMTNYIFWTVIFSIIGARLYYVIFNFKDYMFNILDIFNLRQGGLAIHGGILFGLISTIYFTKKYKIDKVEFLDCLVYSLIIGQAIGRWGNFFNSEAHGGVVTLEFLKFIHIPQFIINGMKINGILYHPTFFYESFFCFIGFIIMTFIKKKKSYKVGSCLVLYLMWYGILRFFIESLRTDSLYFLNIKVAQVVSIIMILIGIYLFIHLKLYKKNKN